MDGIVTDWFSAPGYWHARFLFLHALGLIYLLAFLSAANQFRGLLGEHGLLPVPDHLRRVPFRRAPSIFHLYYSDGFFAAVAWTGVALSAAVTAGLADIAPLWASMLLWAVLWVLYLSIVNVGQTWYAFGWESLLVEAGFLAVFLGPADMAPPVLVLFLLRWLLFRLEFGAGLIKLRGDPCWRSLTCLRHHHETQPMPGPLSWYFHRLPDPLHRVEAAANHVTQLVVPFALLAPQPAATWAAGVVIVTQLWLVLSGNFAWLNALTITVAFSALDGSLLSRVLPVSPPATLADPPPWFAAVVLALFAAFAVLAYWPIRNMASRRQRMNINYNPLHLGNSYGAFGSIERHRYEVVIEGTDDEEVTPDTVWREYEFRGKPGDPRRRPPQVAPYHLRLDWLMWFAAISPAFAGTWFPRLVAHLLRGDRAVLRLLRHNPFPDAPPALIRARLYHYRFTTWRERRETGAWWVRTLVGDFLPPVAAEAVRAQAR